MSGLLGVSVVPKMKRPFFSCVMPVKGSRPYMEEALESLTAQGMGDELEVIVQDGDVEPDAGQSDALNKGFAKARGEWFFWLNADDVLLRGALKKVLDRIYKIDRSEWIAGNTVYTDEKGIAKDVRTDAKWRPWFGKHMTVWSGGPSAFFKRELWERSGGFDINLRYVMDIDLWTRWAKAGVRFESLNDYVWGFRWHEGSTTASGNNKAAHIKEKRVLLSRYGIGHPYAWRNLTRAASFLDGMWFKRQRDSRLLHGIHWSEIKC